MKSGVEYKVIRRSIKYPRLELKNGDLVVIAPRRIKVKPIIEKHQQWIDKKIRFIREATREVKGSKLAKREEKELKKLIRMLVKRANNILRVKPRKIRFRKMRTKWASCSKNGNITFNKTLRYLPKKLIWYITFHEMTHLIVSKHNKKFWHLVNREFKNVEKIERQLFGFWFLACKVEKG